MSVNSTVITIQAKSVPTQFFTTSSSSRKIEFKDGPITTPIMEPIILLVVLLLLAWLQTYQRKTLQQHYYSFLNNRFTQQLLRSENTFFNPTAIGLCFISLLMMGLFVYKLGNTFDWLVLIYTNGLGLLICVLALIILFSIKAISIILGSILLKARSFGDEYMFNVILFNGFISIALIPALLLEAYSPFSGQGIFLWIALGLVGLGYTGKATRLIKQGIKLTSVSSLYIILYLCALEILPLATLFKVLVIID